MAEMPEERLRVAELTANVTNVLPGEFKDWPANIQDGIMIALEKHANRKRATFEIAYSKSDIDVDSGPFVHVIAVGVPHGLMKPPGLMQ